MGVDMVRVMTMTLQTDVTMMVALVVVVFMTMILPAVFLLRPR